MYAKDIVDFIFQNAPYRGTFSPFMVLGHPENFNTVSISQDILEEGTFEKWMVEEGCKKSFAIRKYLFFLRIMIQVFGSVLYYFDKENPYSKDPKDAPAIHTSVDEMLFIANYLYVLKSYGIPGNMLECGCFRGFSTCCLSWACAFLGVKLFVADSFEGLPQESDQSFYNKGDFAASFEDVSGIIATLGKPENVEFIRGYYERSLQGFNRSLCLLWMDVDLYGSAKDVLRFTLESLHRSGVIFSNEFSAQFITHDFKILKTHLVPRAFVDYFASEEIAYTAEFVKDFTALVVPFAPHNTKPLFSVPNFQHLIDLLRLQMKLETAKKTVESKLPDQRLQSETDSRSWLVKLFMNRGS